MKSPTYYLTLKLVALFFATLLFVCTVVSALGITVLLDLDGYRATFDEICYEYVDGRYSWVNVSVAERFSRSLKSGNDFAQELNLIRSEVPFTVYFSVFDANGTPLYSDYDGREYAFVLEETVETGGAWVLITPSDKNTDLYNENLSQYTTWVPECYRVCVYGTDLELTGNQKTEFSFLRFFHYFRIPLIPIFFVSLFGFLALFVFLCASAGRKIKGAPAEAGPMDRVLLEIYLACFLMVLWLEIGFLQIAPDLLWFVFLFLGIFSFVDCLVALLMIMSLATRIKTGTLFSTTLLSYGLRGLSWLKRATVSFFENCRLVPKVILVLSATAIFDFFLASLLRFTEFLAAVLIEGLVLMGILVWYGASLQKLGEDQKKVASGDLNHRCDSARLPPGLRSLGEALNRSAEGMERAVEEKMKSERFKTELITNVSHDIKTPLTSIVNYVDLMKKEETENQKLREYLEVLDRQSLRLRKLTEDLVESSKAASGVLPVTLAPLDLKVFLEQTLGEYQLNLEEAGLSPCLEVPQEPLFVLADGKRLWRVVDNLMNNITKYALSGTRVYLTARENGGRCELIFRNISAARPQRSGEELTERFVQGDMSRKSEGSGLGLAIAKSFTELQNGVFDVVVDGDLFKVTLSFERI